MRLDFENRLNNEFDMYESSTITLSKKRSESPKFYSSN